jgi:glycosyltransferase involved in cell wall biosynthesis
MWNLPLLYTLARRGIPVLHTLHDLDPHQGVRFGRLIRLWNRLAVRSGAHIVVHARRYRDRLIAGGLPAARITVTPLLHGFWGWETEQRLRRETTLDVSARRMSNLPMVMFFGRLEAYKGLDTLLAAWRLLTAQAEPGAASARLVIAGQSGAGVSLGELPPCTEVRDRLIEDDEGIELFRQASLLVLPYRDATQTAFIAAAYRFGVPVLATETGALPEYVVPGETGWLVPPNDPAALAAALRAALADPACLQRMGSAGALWRQSQRVEEEGAFCDLYGRLAARVSN